MWVSLQTLECNFKVTAQHKKNISDEEAETNGDWKWCDAGVTV